MLSPQAPGRPTPLEDHCEGPLTLQRVGDVSNAALNRHTRPLIARHPRYRGARWTWFALVLAVAVKLGWVLRPFVGDPQLPFTWWREGWDDDPYMNLFWAAASLVVRALRAIGLA